MKKRPIVSAYYFPNWHVDERNEKLHGKNWTEWRVVQYATPRFEGHLQPKVPLWGYGDEADPAVMSQKIKAAVDHGIDAFVFDWYYFFDGSYRERCLLEGFLPAPNCQDIQFALMWANHNPIYSHPGNYRKPSEALWSGAIDPETFYRCTEHVIETYFKQPNYLRVNGKLFFGIYNFKGLLTSLGGRHATRIFFDDFRHRVEKAGLGELQLDTMIGYPEDWEDANTMLRETGFDSCSNYSNLRGNGFPSFEYDEMTDRNVPAMEQLAEKLCVPYNPVITTGFDNSPRTVQSDMYEEVGYPFSAVAVNNGPEHWERCLKLAKAFTDSDAFTGDILHLSCWNEWTEGAYLEPDTESGYGRLEALRRVFGKR